MTDAPLTLYSFWRSQAAYRVRIALHLKGVSAEMKTIDLLKGEQHRDDYRAINPEGLVPALLEANEPPLIQSLAILEYIDERYPEPPLLPKAPRDRAYVRAIAQTPVIDSHPLIVPRVRNYLANELGIAEPARNAWLKHWLEEGNRAVEALLKQGGKVGRFAFGDTVTLADICIVPHLTTAAMLYDLDLAPYPVLAGIQQNCMALEAFAKTQPRLQPGAPAGH
jgi:maleylacetoacetate isomerase